MFAARIRRSPDGAMAYCAGRLETLSRRSDRLIESLLAFARGGHRSDAAGSAPVELTVREAADDLAALTCDAGATIRLDLDQVTVRCPAALLYTVVVNLLGNAVKFVNGRARREISVAAHQVGSHCEITVSDTGPGIPEEWRAKVFAPFVRVPGTTAQGSGIGLATVHRIVRAHGGEVEVRANGGEGTTFIVRLPLSDPAVDASPTGPADHGGSLGR
jgi:signal transduction histidine kinase